MALPNNGTTNVGVSLQIYGLKGVDTLLSTATVSCSLSLYWHDSRLEWNPEENEGIKKTRLFTDPSTNRNYIWTPDLESYENANKKLLDGFRSGMA